MLHRDAEMIYQDLIHKWQAGTVTESQFYETVNRLQVIDADGFYWQIRAADGVWLRWNGSSWEEQPRPLDNPAQGHTSSPHQVLPNAAQPTQINTGAMQNQQAAGQGPQSLLGLLGMMLKGFAKGLPVKIVKSLVIIGLAWLFHTYLLAYVNDGYYFVKHPILGMVLSMQGNANGGTYFWTLMAGSLTTLYCRARAEGVKPLTSKILSVPTTVMSHAKAPDFKGLIFLFIAGAVAVLISLHFARDISFHQDAQAAVNSVLLPNRMLYLAFFLSIVVALSNHYNGFVFMVCRLVKQDAHKMFPKSINPQLDPRIIYSIISGLALGFAVMVILPFLPYSGYIFILIFIALAAMAFFKNKPVSPVYLILAGTAVAAYLIPPVREVLACYGGFHEYGGTLDSWLNNPTGNAPTTMGFGVPPAIGVAIGALIPPIISDLFPGDYDSDIPEEPDEEEDEIVGYILQLSTNQVTLINARPQTVDIKAWQVKSLSGYQPAPHAALQVQPPAATSGLSLTPLNGQDTMTLSIAQTGEAETGNFQSTVTASADGMSTSATINITVELEARIEAYLKPKEAIYPDGKDGTWIYARVVAKGDLSAEQLEEANRKIEFVAVGAGKAWAEISEKKEKVEDWTLAWAVAWNYDARGATLVPPPSISIEAFSYIGETRLSKTVSLELLEMPQLRLEVDRLEFLEGGQVSEIISAVVDPPGENPNWTFSYEWEESFNCVRVAIIEPLNNQARFELKEQGTAEKGSKSQQDWATLKIFARQEEVELERHLRVVISREGLYAVKDYSYRDDIYRVNADGEKIPLEIGFQLLVWNDEKKCLEGDRERIVDLDFRPDPQEEIHNKALLTGDLHIKSTGLREQTIPVGLYEFTINNELPGNGELYVFPVTAYVDEYSTDFNLGIQIKEIDPMAGRNLELERIQLIIDRHVPDQLKGQLQNKLDQEKINTLNGAEELYLLRHDIWEKTRDAWHAEAANYKQNAAFNDWCVYALDWVVWAGDKAFEKAIELKIKAVSGNNKKLVKFSKYIGKLTRDLTIDAINAYIYENKTPNEWLYELIVPVTDQIYAGIGDALWKQLMVSLGYDKLAKWIDDCYKRNIYNADGAQKDGLELDAGIQLVFFEVIEKIMDYIIGEAKKKAWKMALDYMKETEISIEYRPNMEVRIPGTVFVWCCKRIKTFYDNYYTKKKTLLEAAKATVFKWVDEETDKYLDELEKLEAKKKEPKTGRKKETGQELIDRLKLNPEQLSEKRKNEILKLISENKSLKGYNVDFKKLADLYHRLPQ